MHSARVHARGLSTYQGFTMPNITKVKQTALPPAGAHWSYGLDYMRGISKADAAALCGMYTLPTMGHETTVALAPDGFGGFFRLMVQNISGTYFAACSNVRVGDWPEVFKVQVVEPAVHA